VTSRTLILAHHEGSPRAVGQKSDYYGRISVDLVGPPRRLYGDGAHAPPLLQPYVDALRVRREPTPAELLDALPPGDNWLAQSGRTLARLHASFLVAEDPQGRLVGRAAATLAHQASLVRHVLESNELTRVLIADEVGLGKTIEAGLLIQGLLERDPGLRVLYLAPARLVANVYREFREKLDLTFRQFSASDIAQADVDSDPLVVASIHRAVHPSNRGRFAAAPPWDVLVVDECHHLSARGPNGQGANEQYDLVRQLIERQAPGARLVLLSGTPHQGSRARFDNLLHLLRRREEPKDAVRGRVIFRTKEDVRDWDGRPLFPKRHVREPHVVQLGQTYERWYAAIAELYDGPAGSEAVRRAASWAKGQALQWAASSVQAGLGFLCRLAIRRLGWAPVQAPALAEALAALRPYKNGSPSEPVPALHARMLAEVQRQMREHDADDMEELEEETWKPDPRLLAALLEQGTMLLRSPAAAVKWSKLLELLAETPNEKVVLFAQPVETVTALAQFLERELKQRPAVIVGGQTDAERDLQIEAFRRADGARLLVSSRAGGEGINLQVARRLVHLDVPWNPMDMEQRVGRVHRFGSHQTILVDTIVVEGTREVDTYRVAREKLRVAFGAMASDQQRFEALFSRVMSLIPPQQLEELLGAGAPGPITPEDTERLGALVEEGLRRWQEFHAEYAEQQRTIAALNPGHATWDDLRAFLVERGGAEPVAGYTMTAFREVGGQVVAQAVEVEALRLDGAVYSCGDTGGMRATGTGGSTAAPLGLNVTPVTKRLRASIFPEIPTGAAWLRLQGTVPPVLADAAAGAKGARATGVLGMFRQRITLQGGSATEHGVELRLLLVPETGAPVEVQPEARGDVVRALLAAVRQQRPNTGGFWPTHLESAELSWMHDLAHPTDEERAQGVRSVLWPLIAAVVSIS